VPLALQAARPGGSCNAPVERKVGEGGGLRDRIRHLRGGGALNGGEALELHDALQLQGAGLGHDGGHGLADALELRGLGLRRADSGQQHALLDPTQRGVRHRHGVCAGIRRRQPTACSSLHLILGRHQADQGDAGIGRELGTARHLGHAIHADRRERPSRIAAHAGSDRRHSDCFRRHKRARSKCTWQSCGGDQSACNGSKRVHRVTAGDDTAAY